MLQVELNSAHAPRLFSGAATVVTLATDIGMMQILPGHLSLVGTSQATPIVINTPDNQELTFLARALVVTVKNSPSGDTLVSLSGQLVDKKEEVTIESLQEFQQKMHAALENKEDLSSYQVEFLTEQLDSVDKALVIHKG